MLHLFCFYDIISKFRYFMKEMKITNSLALKVYDSEDYVKNLQNIYAELKSVYDSWQNATIRDYVENLNSDIFFENKKIYINILMSGDDTVSFAIFSKKSNASVILNAICTHSEYAKLGFATILLRASACNLKDEKINEIIIDNNDDIILKNLLDSFAKVEGVEYKENEKFCKFCIKNIKNEQILSKIKQFYI